ncbi:hypothetical protein [Pantoea ananatis]|nr:hypothetical protein [Pantoea ananatis]
MQNTDDPPLPPGPFTLLNLPGCRSISETCALGAHICSIALASLVSAG